MPALRRLLNRTSLDPMHISIRVLAQSDIEAFLELIHLFEDVFEMQDFTAPDIDHLQEILAKPGFNVIGAFDGELLVGGLTVYTLDQYYSARPLAYLFDLAVATRYQRQGVGRKLMAFTTAYFREHGYDELFVQADRVDAHALEFYRGTNPTQVDEVIHFTYEFPKFRSRGE